MYECEIIVPFHYYLTLQYLILKLYKVCKLYIFSVKRLLDANGIDYRETNIIGFFCIGTQEEYEGDVIPFAYKITLNGQVDEEVSLFEEFNIKSSIEEISKSILKNLYDSFSQPSIHPHNTGKS